MIWIVFALLGQVSHAQYQTGNWIKLDYTYTDLNSKSVDVNETKAQFPGVRGELGLNVMRYLAVSAVGEYADYRARLMGALVDGQPVDAVTSNFTRDLRVMGHLVVSPFVLSAGIAERFWSQQIPAGARTRTTYAYLPAQLTYFFRRAYLSYEQDFVRRGHRRMDDDDSTLGTTQAFAVELGWLIPSAIGATQIFARYQKWSVKATDQWPEEQTTLLQAGIGVGF